MDTTHAHQKLSKTLTPTQVWALALGSIVGWGCFVLPGDMFLPQSGPLPTVLAFFGGAFLFFFVATVYGYMIEYVPVAGGEYAYTYTGFGPTAAFVCGWALVLGYIVIVAINISALALLVRFLFPGVFEFGELYTIVGWKVYTGEVLLMSAATVFFGIMNYRGVRIAGTLQIFLAFALSFGVLLLAFGVFTHETTSVANLEPLFAPARSRLSSFLAILAIAPFLFVGFDTVPQAAEEFSFSPKKSRRIMLAAILWGAILYSLVTLSVAIIMPYPELLAKMEAMKNEGVTAWATGEVCKIAFGQFGAYVLATCVLGAVCTGINGFYVASTRLLLSMARGNILPAWFAEIHPRFQSPYKAILFTMAIVLLTPWSGRAVVGWIVDMSSVGTAIAYLFTCMAAYRMFTSKSDVKNKTLKIMCCHIGSLASILCIVLLLVPGSPAFIGLPSRIIMLVWIVIGIVFYLMVRKDWQTMDEKELRLRILGNANLPVFFKQK